jgi:pimeloyl-ACP methyl ester carboxylesterase
VAGWRFPGSHDQDRPGDLQRTSGHAHRSIEVQEPALVLCGASDIFGDGTAIVRRRFPHAVQVTLEGSGHVHWLQNLSGYANALGDFYERVLGSP